MAEIYQPLVSVPVVTYNSSKTVIETLDSIYNQTYPNIELIVSDDCSPDNTVEICREWIATHKDRFVRTELLTVEKNTGVTGNCNRAEDACHGEWKKGIAGDDILLPTCIEDNVNYVREHPDSILVFSKPHVFGLSEERCKNYEENVFDYSFFSMSPDEQYERIKLGSCLPAASSFVNIPRFRALGIRNDERIPMLEDRPKWINCIWKGVRFDFMDKYTVMYRLHEGSLANSQIRSPKFYESYRLTYFYYVFQKEFERDKELAIRDVVASEMEIYQKYATLYYDYKDMRNSVWGKIYVYLRDPQKILRTVKNIISPTKLCKK